MKNIKTTIPEELIHIVVLDISGVYAQIYEDGYFTNSQIKEINKQYCNLKHWKIVEIR